MAVKVGGVDFYTAFAAAVRGEERQQVPAYEGVRTLAVIHAARRSAHRGESVLVPPEQVAALHH